MRYVIHPCDDGRYFILDTETDSVMLYCGNYLLAQKVCRMMNGDSGRTDLDTSNITKTH